MRTVFLSVLVLCLAACNNESEDINLHSSQDTLPASPAIKQSQDTEVISKPITDEIAGSAYRKRAIGYSVVMNGDTSVFQAVFMEAKDGGKVNIESRFDKNKTYEQHYHELSRILPVAAKDFNMDSLNSIYIGRLISAGDMAIEVSNEWVDKNGPYYDVNNRKAAEFLMGTKLASDINKLFEKYAIELDHFSVEKVFFTGRKDVYGQSVITSDSAKVPSRILDCMTWIGLKKK